MADRSGSRAIGRVMLLIIGIAAALYFWSPDCETSPPPSEPGAGGFPEERTDPTRLDPE